MIKQQPRIPIIAFERWCGPWGGFIFGGFADDKGFVRDPALIAQMCKRRRDQVFAIGGVEKNKIGFFWKLILKKRGMENVNGE